MPGRGVISARCALRAGLLRCVPLPCSDCCCLPSSLAPPEVRRARRTLRIYYASPTRSASRWLVLEFTPSPSPASVQRWQVHCIRREQRFDTHASRGASLRCASLHTFVVLGLPLRTAVAATCSRRRRSLERSPRTMCPMFFTFVLIGPKRLPCGWS